MIATLLLTGLLTFPILSLGIGMTESAMNPYVTGKHKEQGPFQIRERYWGKVPKSTVSQYKQHDKILVELMQNHNQNSMKAVEQYNGKGLAAKKYAKTVRRHSIEIALLTNI